MNEYSDYRVVRAMTSPPAESYEITHRRALDLLQQGGTGAAFCLTIMTDEDNQYEVVTVVSTGEDRIPLDVLIESTARSLVGVVDSVTEDSE